MQHACFHKCLSYEKKFAYFWRKSAVKLKDEQFLMKLAYLSDIFGKLNVVNLQHQGRDKHLPHLADKISSFAQKLDVWNKYLERGNTDSFENLSETK